MKNKNTNKTILFTVGVHGDEQSPVKVIKAKLYKNNYVVCNQAALKQNVRFIDSDLNRSFPGNQNGSIEEKIAYKLVNKLKKYQFAIDIHTATCATPPFIIITKITPAHINLAAKTGVNRVVLMNQEFGAGKSLIDFVPVGISIESGCEYSQNTEIIIEKIITKVFENKINNRKPAIFQVFKTLTKADSKEFLTPKIRPFKLVTTGTQITNLGQKAEVDFYPVLPRSKNYPNFLCLMAKKVNLLDLNVKISI